MICASRDAASGSASPPLRAREYCWRLQFFSSRGSMWKELRTTRQVCMCCHVTYESVELFQIEKSRR